MKHLFGKFPTRLHEEGSFCQGLLREEEDLPRVEEEATFFRSSSFKISVSRNRLYFKSAHFGVTLISLPAD
jgi:hypothetical protein